MQSIFGQSYFHEPKGCIRYTDSMRYKSMQFMVHITMVLSRSARRYTRRYNTLAARHHASSLWTMAGFFPELTDDTLGVPEFLLLSPDSAARTAETTSKWKNGVS